MTLLSFFPPNVPNENRSGYKKCAEIIRTSDAFTFLNTGKTRRRKKGISCFIGDRAGVATGFHSSQAGVLILLEILLVISFV